MLGVDKDASKEEIKKAYYKLAHKHHPDKGGDEKKFKEINEAYQILSDEKKRRQYDQFGRTFEGEGHGFGGSPYGDFSGFSRTGGAEFDLGDIFDEFFGAGRAGKTTRKGKDIRVDVELSLPEVLQETVKTINLRRQVVCKRCGGSGAEPGTSVEKCPTCGGEGTVQEVRRTFLGSMSRTTVCPQCHGEGQRPKESCNVCGGEGRVQKEEEIKINIPPGVDHNQMLKMKGKGHTGRRGAPAGDLYIRVFVKEHPRFERRGDDLYLERKIPFSLAVLGGEVDIKTLGGRVIGLKVPKGTPSGKVFRVSGKGVPHFRRSGRGDLYVELEVDVPRRLSRRGKNLIEEMKKEGL